MISGQQVLETEETRGRLTSSLINAFGAIHTFELAVATLLKGSGSESKKSTTFFTLSNVFDPPSSSSVAPQLNSPPLTCLPFA